MRLAIRLVLGLGLLLATAFALTYAIASSPGPVMSQPRTVEEAERTIEALGLSQEYPFEHHFFESPHGRMHYVAEGSGSQTVLAIHGNPTWSFLYRNFVKGLSDNARVVVPDLLGFGLSEKNPDWRSYSIAHHIEDVVALVDELDVQEITLVVQDWGGPIGLGVALERPERIRAIVAMNTMGFIVPGQGDEGPPAVLRMLQLPLLGEFLVQGLGAFNRAGIAGGIAREERRSELVLRAYDDVAGDWGERAGALSFPRLIPTSPDDPSIGLLEREGEWLESFEGEVLLFWGMKDFAFGPPVLAEWKRRFPQAPVVELPDAGHFLQEDGYERIVPEIRALLERQAKTPKQVRF